VTSRISTDADLVEATATALALAQQALADFDPGATRAKLAVATAATERAAVGMLEGLERAMATVALLMREDGADAVRRARYASLDDDLRDVMTYVRLRELANRHLGQAASALVETERRLDRLRAEPTTGAPTPDPSPADAR
jgi:hypothetical protein